MCLGKGTKERYVISEKRSKRDVNEWATRQMVENKVRSFQTRKNRRADKFDAVVERTGEWVKEF